MLLESATVGRFGAREQPGRAAQVISSTPALQRGTYLTDTDVKGCRTPPATKETPDAEGRKGTLLNSRDIAALNRAREVLKRLDDAAWRRSLGYHDPYGSVTAWDLGRLSEAATAAENAIFNVLSTARTQCRVKISDAQLAGTRQPEAAQPTEPVHRADRAQSTEVTNGLVSEQITRAREDGTSPGDRPDERLSADRPPR